VWVVLFASASACWFALWASLNLLLRARPAMTSDVARLFKALPRPEIFSSGIVLAVFRGPIAFGAGIAAGRGILDRAFRCLPSPRRVRNEERRSCSWPASSFAAVSSKRFNRSRDTRGRAMAGGGGVLLRGGVGLPGCGAGAADRAAMGAHGAVRARPGRDAEGKPADGGVALDRPDRGGGDLADAYNNRGIVRVRLGRTREGLADFEAAAGSHPESGRPNGTPTSCTCRSSTLRRPPDPAGRLDRDPRPRPLRLPRRGDDPRRDGRFAASGRDVWGTLAHRAGRGISGGPGERVPPPVLPPRSRGMGSGVPGGRGSLGWALETSLPDDLDEQRLPLLRRQHDDRREPRARRRLQQVPRAGRQGDSRAARRPSGED